MTARRDVLEEAARLVGPQGGEPSNKWEEGYCAAERVHKAVLLDLAQQEPAEQEWVSLPADVVAMCKHRGWSLHWTHRGAYLHLEASELIEAIRGKRGDPMKEAADVLLVLMSITEYAGIPWSSVLKQARAKNDELMTRPRYEGEEHDGSSLSERTEVAAGQDVRRKGHSALRGKPLDENGGVMLETFDPHQSAVPEGMPKEPLSWYEVSAPGSVDERSVLCVYKDDYDALRQYAARLQVELAEARSDLAKYTDIDVMICEAQHTLGALDGEMLIDTAIRVADRIERLDAALRALDKGE